MNMILCLPTKILFSVPKTTPRSFYRIHAKTTDSGIHFSICLNYLIDIDELKGDTEVYMYKKPLNILFM